MELPEVKKIYKNPSLLVYNKFDQLFGFKPNEWKAFEISKTDINKFRKELKHVAKQIKKGKIIGLTGSLLYTTSAIARRNPMLAKLYDNFLSTSHAYNGNENVADTDFSLMLKDLKDESKIRGISTDYGFTKGQKRLSKLENDIQKLLIDVENNVPGAEQKLGEKTYELDQYVSKGEGQIYKEFIELIESKKKGLRSIPEIDKIVNDRWGKNLTESNIKTIRDQILKSGIKLSSFKLTLFLFINGIAGQ